MFLNPAIMKQLIDEREADIQRSLTHRERGSAPVARRLSLAWAARERRGPFRIRPAPLAPASR